MTYVAVFLWTNKPEVDYPGKKHLAFRPSERTFTILLQFKLLVLQGSHHQSFHSGNTTLMTVQNLGVTNQLYCLLMAKAMPLHPNHVVWHPSNLRQVAAARKANKKRPHHSFMDDRWSYLVKSSGNSSPTEFSSIEGCIKNLEKSSPITESSQPYSNYLHQFWRYLRIQIQPAQRDIAPGPRIRSAMRPKNLKRGYNTHMLNVTGIFTY